MNVALMNLRITFQKNTVVTDAIGNRKNAWENYFAFLQSEPEEVTEYSEALVRRMIEKISVYDDHFVVEFKSGIEITINE